MPVAPKVSSIVESPASVRFCVLKFTSLKQYECDVGFALIVTVPVREVHSQNKANILVILFGIVGAVTIEVHPQKVPLIIFIEFGISGMPSDVRFVHPKNVSYKESTT